MKTNWHIISVLTRALLSTVLLYPLFYGLGGTTAAATSKVTAFVDEKQELSATVWILAGCEEYDRGVYPPYYRDIQRYFRKFKSHPVMDFIRQMRDAPDSVYVVSYNSVPCAAELLYIEDGHVKVKEGIDIAEYLRTQDPRWTEENFLKYAALLDDFYVKSDYHRFFEKHSKLYREYADSLQAGMRRLIDPDWFQDVYGEPLPDVSACVSPAYAWNNYSGPDTLTQRLLGYERTGYYPLIGVSSKPEYASNMYINGNVIIHEISHSFTNPILENYENEEQEVGRIICPYMEQELYRAGYDWQSLYGESVRRVLQLPDDKPVPQGCISVPARPVNKRGPEPRLRMDERGGGLHGQVLRKQRQVPHHRRLHAGVRGVHALRGLTDGLHCQEAYSQGDNPRRRLHRKPRSRGDTRDILRAGGDRHVRIQA